MLFFFFFASLLLLLIVSLTPFISKPDSSSDSTIYVISFKSSFENTNVVVPEPYIFYWIAASVAEGVAVNPNGTKTILANGASTLFINGKPTDNNDFRKLRNPPSWQVIFSGVPFNKISLFSEGLIIFTISFVTLFVSTIPEFLNNDKGFILILLLARIYPGSKKNLECFYLF